MVEPITVTAATIFDLDRTQDFSSWQQIEQYIGQWFRSREQEDLGQRLCTALQQHGRARIWNLVKNPQRLKLLCFNWGLRQSELPKTQAELYQGFVEYISQSQESFEIASQQRQQLHTKLAQLSRDAIEQEQTPSPFRLRQEFVCRYLGRLDAEGSLFRLTLNLGLLHQVEVDTQKPHEGIYAFIHPTIQEYFAALAIDDGNFFLHHTSSNPDAPNASYRIFAPQWKPVFLFWLGRFDVEQFHKENLIQSLVDFQDGCGGFYNYRAIFLAAAAIAQFPEYTHSDEMLESVIQLRLHGSKAPIVTGAQAALEETDTHKALLILERLLSTSEDEETRISAAYCLGRIDNGNHTAIQALELLSTSEDEKTRISAARCLGIINNGNHTAIQALVGLLSTTQDKPIRRKAADALVEIGTGNHTAIGALELLLDETTQDKEIRYEAAKSLGKIDIGNDKAIRELVRLLEISQGGYIGSEAGESRWKIGTGDTIGNEAFFLLERIGTGNDTAIRELVRLLSTTQDKEIRNLAAFCLERIGTRNDTAIREVVGLLSTTQDKEIRREASFILETIGIGNPTARQEVKRLLSTTQDKEIRREAAWILWKIAAGNHMPRRLLEQQLATIEDDNDIRREAAKSLKAFSAGNDTAIPEVVRLATSQDKDISRWAVLCLERIGTGNDTVIRETVIREVVGLLSTTQPYGIRTWAADYLWKIGTGNDTAIRGLVGLLATSQGDGNISWLAVTGLKRIGTGNPTAIGELEQLLSTSQDDYIRRDAARLLWKIDPGNDTAIQALEQLLLTSQNRFIRWVAASSLGEFDPGNDTAIRELVRLLATAQDYDFIGLDAAKSLEEIGTGNDTAIRELELLLLTTQDDYIREIAVKSLSNIKQTHEQYNTLVELLHGNLQHPRTYELIWECADKLLYTDFYRAFRGCLRRGA